MAYAGGDRKVRLSWEAARRTRRVRNGRAIDLRDCRPARPGGPLGLACGVPGAPAQLPEACSDYPRGRRLSCERRRSAERATLFRTLAVL